MHRHVLAFVMLATPVPGALAETALAPGTKFQGRDTLETGQESSEDARACLAGLAWPVSEFVVRCDQAKKQNGSLLVRFPSPVTSGDAANDLVAMEWYVARDPSENPIKAPAIVVVHESGSGMTVGRVFARGLQQQGLHAFMIHLPFYGQRRTGQQRPTESNLVTVIRQAVADVRRARDAVAVLPLIDRRHIALQGTSLGGFVAATTAGLDRGYQSVFLMLAGGNLFDVIQNGEKDTARVRETLADAGLKGEKLKSLLQIIEPTRIAHRLDPSRTWLYSGQFDQVVPLSSALALGRAARLEPPHHIRLPANHYTGIVFLPFVLTHMREQINELPENVR